MSSKGRRARAPRWWGELAERLPRIYVPFLSPKSWTPELARKWIERVPSKCPFERQFWWGETLVLYVPPLCPLNPLSTQFYSLRLEAQTYLARLEADKKSV